MREPEDEGAGPRSPPSICIAEGAMSNKEVRSNGAARAELPS